MTVFRWMKRYEEEGHVKRKEGSGLDTGTTAEEDVELVNAAIINPH